MIEGVGLLHLWHLFWTLAFMSKIRGQDCPSYWSPTVSIRRDGLIDNPLMCRAGVLIPPVWYRGRQELKVCVVKKDWIQWIDQGDRWILMWASSSPPPFTRILAHTVVLEHSQILPNFCESFFSLFQKRDPSFNFLWNRDLIGTLDSQNRNSKRPFMKFYEKQK